ncbi:hypothetical protein KC887_04775 [Candidatus Kaiserbacteria bacterium]|nr:hypothetical protein [Candidatus Kaiserbacteria bacterium]
MMNTNFLEQAKTFVAHIGNMSEVARRSSVDVSVVRRLMSNQDIRTSHSEKILSYAYSTGWTYNKENHEDNQAGGLKDD